MTSQVFGMTTRDQSLKSQNYFLASNIFRIPESDRHGLRHVIGVDALETFRRKFQREMVRGLGIGVVWANRRTETLRVLPRLCPVH